MTRNMAMRTIASMGIGFMFASIVLPFFGIETSLTTKVLGLVGWIMAIIGHLFENI